MDQPDVITGIEPHEGLSSPVDALVAFYRAFNSRDIDGLRANWAAGDEPSMDNPIGGIRRGWSSIAEGYGRLFGGGARVYVEFHDYTIHAADNFALFVGRERGRCTSHGVDLSLQIRTSRLFVLRGNDWRQLHHHGSIESPSVLADYQKAILGSPVQ